MTERRRFHDTSADDQSEIRNPLSEERDLCRLGYPPLEKDLSAPDDLRQAVLTADGKQLIYWHVRFSQHAAILNEKLLPDLRIIVLTRHPLDRLISPYTKALGGPLPHPEHSPP
jgi:hypothetical protein